MKKLTVSLLIVTLLTSIAQAAPHTGVTTLIAEQRTPNGLEQKALVWDKDEIRLVMNSNFLSDQGPSALLGKFKATRPKSLKTLRQAVEKAKQACASLSENKDGSPHRLRMFVGECELSRSSQQYTDLYQTLRTIEKAAVWKPEDAIKLTIASNGKPAVRTLSSPRKKAPEPACQTQRQNELSCRVPEYGTATLFVK